MNARALYEAALPVWFALAGAVFVALFFVPAPYGRYAARARGPLCSARAGWLLMEAPAVVVFGGIWLASPARAAPASLLFLGLWMWHYADRALLYPWRLPARARPMPVAVVALGFLFNVVNASLNAGWLFALSGGYPDSWLRDPRLVGGVALFAAGWLVNRTADAELARLRASGGYGIPRGALYRRISCPNYLGEIAIWCGWALATWSRPGLAFVLWTVANLAPRARRHHHWYRERFPEYPAERKALLPGIW
ncbi:MAG: 3-oxo-5-alpha-steroid 4-dehydrogenase [Thermoanaerobaculia bacterium]|nr:MAG: 3-oxo-5-alpha-steroid 4-dehydrogenase [Thermoanaerobaculia bacterium]